MSPYDWREKRRVGLGCFEPANEETSTMCQGGFGFSVTDSDEVAERFELSVGVVFLVWHNFIKKGEATSRQEVLVG